MSELSTHDLEPSGVPDPVTAGFPAAQIAAAAPQLPATAAALADELPDPALAAELLDEPTTSPDRAPRLAGRGRPGKRLVADAALERSPLTPQQRLLILDSWVRSGLPAGDFAPLVGLSEDQPYYLLWRKLSRLWKSRI